MKKLLALIALALALFLGGGAYSYHVLAPLEAETDRAWAAADAAITARAAAAPELIAFIHSYTSRGQEAFRAAEDAQKRLAAAQTPAARMAASDALSSALGQILAAGSRYRSIVGHPRYYALTTSLAAAENTLAVARRDYNNAAERYNGAFHSAPQRFYGRMLGFRNAPYFKTPRMNETK